MIDVKQYLTHHNGYIFVDPEVKEGGWAVLDADYGSGGGTVYVHKLNQIFAVVSSKKDSAVWSTMRNRLIRHKKERYAR